MCIVDNLVTIRIKMIPAQVPVKPVLFFLSDKAHLFIENLVEFAPHGAFLHSFAVRTVGVHKGIDLGLHLIFIDASPATAEVPVDFISGQDSVIVQLDLIVKIVVLLVT